MDEGRKTREPPNGAHINLAYSHQGEEEVVSTSRTRESVGGKGFKIDDSGEKQEQECGKFRLFVNGLLLVGITLVLYSRAVLPISAIHMIATNVISKELADIGGAQSQQQRQDDEQVMEHWDNSCPIDVALPEMILDNDSAIELPHDQNNNLDQNQNNIHSLDMDLNLNLTSTGAANDPRFELQQQRQQDILNSVMERLELGLLVDWSPREQGLIYAACSVGNMLMAIPLSRLGEIYGPNKVIVTCALASSLHVLFFPMAAQLPVVWIIAYELAFGALIHGAEVVAFTFFANWLPPDELSFFVSAVMSCFQLGGSISTLTSAYLLRGGFHWSWTFYVPGVLCLIWSLLWLVFASDQPEFSRFVGRGELDFIARNRKRKPNSSGESSGAPWRRILFDKTLWALIVCRFSSRWYYAVYGSMLPTYLNNIVHANIDLIGQLVAANNMIALVASIIIGYLAKSIVVRRPYNLSLTTMRKLFQCVAIYGLAVSLVTMTLFDCDYTIIVLTMVANSILVSLTVAGILQLPMDMSPDYCSVIASINNTLSIGHILGTPVSGLILADGPQDRVHWRWVWWLVAAWQMVGATTFLILVDASPRDLSKRSKGPVDKPSQFELEEAPTTVAAASGN